MKNLNKLDFTKANESFLTTLKDEPKKMSSSEFATFFATLKDEPIKFGGGISQGRGATGTFEDDLPKIEPMSSHVRMQGYIQKLLPAFYRRQQRREQVIEKGLTNYMKYAQPAFKWAISGMPEEDPERFMKMSWADVIRESYPVLSDPESPLARSVAVQFGVETAGELLDIGTRPSTYLIWGVAERLIPPALGAVFRKLPKGVQQSLIKERFIWGRKPLDLAYKELGLKRGASLKEVHKAYRGMVSEWHPDKAPAGQSMKYLRKFLRKQGAYDKIKASTEIIRQGEILNKDLGLPIPREEMAKVKPIIRRTDIGRVMPTKPTMPIKFVKPIDIGTAIEKGDYRSILKMSNIKYDEYVTKNFEPEELKKIQFLFTKGGKSPDIAAADLMIDHPEVGEITGDDIIRNAIAQTGKKLDTIGDQELKYAKELEDGYLENESIKDVARRKIEENKKAGIQEGHKRALNEKVTEENLKELEEFFVERKELITKHPLKITAKDLIQAKDREEIQSLLQRIFGTYEELDKIEAGELPYTKRAELADDFMADLEHAVVEKDTDEVKKILSVIKTELTKADYPEIIIPEAKPKVEKLVIPEERAEKAIEKITESKTIEEATASIANAEHILADEKGALAIGDITEPANVIINTGRKVHDFIFAFGQVKREAPELYKKAMQTFHKQSAAFEQSVTDLNKLMKGKTLSQKEGVQLTFAFEDKRLSPPENLKAEYKKFADLLDKIENAHKERGIFAEGFPQRAINEANAEILEIDNKLTLFNKDITAKDILRKKELLNEIQKLQNFNYLPHTIVVRRVIEAKLEGLSGEKRQAFLDKASRISYQYKQRTGRLFLKDYFETELVKPEDIDIRKLAIEALDSFYVRSALKDLVDYAKTKEWVKLSSKALENQGWIPIRQIGVYAPEYKNMVMHPLLASVYSDLKLMKTPKGTTFTRMLGIVKVAQFYNPMILVNYDLLQMMYGGAYALNPIRETKYWAEAFKQVLTKGDKYHDLHRRGLYQEAYMPGARHKEDLIKIAVRRTITELPKYVKWLEKITKVTWTKENAKHLLGSMYRAIHNGTWTMDRIIRTKSALAYEAMGIPADEAVIKAANWHAAYSELAPKYKKEMGKIVFVQSFRILMPRQMIEAIIREPVELILGKRKAKKGTFERVIKGLVAIFAIPVMVDLYFKARGFERDKLGWKWKKEVMVGGQKQELIVGVNYILNMPLKWWHRLNTYNPISPDIRPIQGIKSFAKWELHPIYRIPMDIKDNKRSFGSGEYVYDPSETNPIKKYTEIAVFVFGQVFRLYGKLMEDYADAKYTTKEKKLQEQVYEEALTKIDRIIINTVGYKYIRVNKQSRQRIMQKSLEKEYWKRLYTIQRKYSGAKQKEMLSNLKTWHSKCSKWINEGFK